MSLSQTSVLGISAYFHDASAALVSDGEIVAAAAEERFTRIKHDSNLPHYAIRFCLEQAGLSPADLDAVVFYECPHTKFTRVLTSTLAGFPRSRRIFTSGMKQWLTSKLWVQAEIAAALKLDPRKIHFVPHHESHLAQAFLTSPFEDSAIVSMDGVGEWVCTAIGHGGIKQGVRTTEILEAASYPHSVGLAYAAFTAFLGFRPNDGEASTMALAAFGKPRYADQVREVLRTDQSGHYRVEDKLFNFIGSGADLFTPRFIQRFGKPRHFRNKLPFDALHEPGAAIASADDQRYADLAASVQQVFEETVIAVAQRARRLTGSSRLCLAGGVFLNAVANSRIIDEAGFDEVFLPPDPGDGGAALGAALLHYCRLSKDVRPVRVSPYLGKGYPADGLPELIQHIDLDECASHAVDGYDPKSFSRIEVDSYVSAEAALDDTAQDLRSGRIVGCVQGRFECGPRALGNRSIFVDPGNLEAVRRLSRQVKSRAAFRPYAFAIRREDVPHVFAGETLGSNCSRWMQMVRGISPNMVRPLRGAVHCDHTTRVQACSSDEAPRLHALLTSMSRGRPAGALLNTSFNESGYPIVASPAEAVLTFVRSGMDVLVVDNFVARKA